MQQRHASKFRVQTQCGAHQPFLCICHARPGVVAHVCQTGAYTQRRPPHAARVSPRLAFSAHFQERQHTFARQVCTHKGALPTQRAPAHAVHFPRTSKSGSTRSPDRRAHTRAPSPRKRVPAHPVHACSTLPQWRALSLACVAYAHDLWHMLPSPGSSGAEGWRTARTAAAPGAHRARPPAMPGPPALTRPRLPRPPLLQTPCSGCMANV